MRMMPVVAATAACSGLRPVAKALGCSSWMTYTRGIGMLARCASSATMPYNSGALWASTSWALYMRNTIWSEFQYAYTFMAPPSSSAISMPVLPPIMPPITTNSAMMAAISILVLNQLKPPMSYSFLGSVSDYGGGCAAAQVPRMVPA